MSNFTLSAFIDFVQSANLPEQTIRYDEKSNIDGSRGVERLVYG